MPFVEKRLISPTSLTTSAATALYTVPTGYTVIVKQIVVTNTTGTAATFTMYIGAASAGNALFSGTSVAANDTVIINLSQVLGTGEILRALSGTNAALNLTVSGVENDGPLAQNAMYIADNAITTAKVADGAITTAKIADGAIVTVDIADGAITTAKIADGAIATVDIANTAVTSAKLADSIALTGTPTAPTAAAGASNTQIASTAFVTTADNLKANIASPTFTGTFNASSALIIDGSGRVTTPLRPAFRYHGWTMTTNGMQGGTAPLNVGSCLTIGSGATYTRFTAPVAGLYFIGASCLIETGAGRVEFAFTKNGSGSIDGYGTYAINNFGASPGGYTDVAGSYIFYLAAGDYIGMTPPVFGTLHGDLTRGDRMFQGFLIG